MLSAREEMAKGAPESPLLWGLWYVQEHPMPEDHAERARWSLEKMVAWSFAYADAMLEAHAKAQQ